MTAPTQTAETVGYQANGAPWGPSFLLATAYTGILALTLAGYRYVAGLSLFLLIPVWYRKDQIKFNYKQIEKHTQKSITAIFYIAPALWVLTLAWPIITASEIDVWSSIAALLSSFCTLAIVARFTMPWIHTSKPIYPTQK